jgi:hypothetical protein
VEVFAFFFFFFNDVQTERLIEKALYLVCGDKLISDGYCDMNLYLYGKVNKDSLQQMLKDIDSPLVYLYKNEFPRADNIIDTLNNFLQTKIMKDYIIKDKMTFVEAQALINWIYKSYRNIAARLDATTNQLRQLLDSKRISGDILIAQGIAYISSKVEMVFISTIEDFYKCIDDVSKVGKTIFYRGHSEVNYSLIPSLMRNDNWLINERKMYNELLMNTPSNFQNLKTHLEYLVEMQHYGLPTRLLDITKNPLVALYFACENHKDMFGEIIILSVDESKIKYPQSDIVSILASLPMFQYEKQQEMYEYAVDKSLTLEKFNEKVQLLLHEIKTEKPAFKDQIVKEDLLHSQVVLSLKNNSRILKQDGAFILCGLSNDYKHLDVNEFKYSVLSGKKQIYIIRNKQKLLESLNAFSINRATLFPEIDAIAGYIKGKYS